MADSRYDFARIWWAGLVTAVVVIAANLGVYAAARAMSVDFLIQVAPAMEGRVPAPVVAVILTSLVSVLIATGSFAFVVRASERPLRTFLIVAIVVLLLSFAAPVSVPASAATKVAFAIMHVVEAAIVVLLLPTTSLGYDD